MLTEKTSSVVDIATPCHQNVPTQTSHCHISLWCISFILLSTAELTLFCPETLYIMSYRGDRSVSVIRGDGGWHLPLHPWHWIGRHNRCRNTSACRRCVVCFVNCINCPAITVCNSCNRSKHCFKEVHEYSYSLINGKTCMHVCT